jgi:hypothetical protein
MRVRVRAALASLLGIGISCASVNAQTLHVGASVGGAYNRANVNPSAVQTIVQLRPGVNIEGDAVSATFGWSASPCPSAVKIKFFRPQELTLVPGPTPPIGFLEERGPFDVTASFDPVRLPLGTTRRARPRLSGHVPPCPASVPHPRM